MRSSRLSMDSSFSVTMGSGMAFLQYASCLDNSNHTGAGRALLSVWTLFRCQSAQEIVRYRRRTRVAGAFPDGNSALMIVTARLKYVADSEWGTRRYLDVTLLDE